MKMFFRSLAVLSAISAFSISALAEEEENEEATVETEESSDAEETEAGDKKSDEKSADDEDENLSNLKVKTSKEEKHFYLLPYCRLLDGSAQVLRPGIDKWEEIEEGKYYPLGTTYRTKGKETRLVIKFGKDADLEINGEASFATRAQAINEKSRTIALVSGVIKVKLPRNFPNGLFIIATPGFKACNLKGDSRYQYEKSQDGDGDTAFVRCVTGSLSVEGRHFKIDAMKVASEVKIRTTNDQLFTGIYGSRGDYIVTLDQGAKSVKDFATGESRVEEKKLNWKMTPQTAVRIHRGIPALGEKMAVTVMTFDANGALRNRCAFTENTAEVNSGELGPVNDKERERLAKKAAEATEEAKAAVGGDNATEEKDSDEEESSDSSDKSADSEDDDF